MNKIDMINLKFGRLTVESEKESRKGQFYYNCKCDCGNNTIVSGANLRGKTVFSCGCLAKELLAKRSKKKKGESALSNKYYSYKVKAKERGFTFNLTKEQFKEIVDKNCYYCNEIPSNISKSRTNNGDYIYNGIDRVDNSIGYLYKNCVPCCGMCNTMKRHYSLEEFKNKIIKIYSFYIINNDK